MAWYGWYGMEWHGMAGMAWCLVIEHVYRVSLIHFI